MIKKVDNAMSITTHNLGKYLILAETEDIYSEKEVATLRFKN